MNNSLVAIIIPARFASTRLPAKLLKLIHGKSVLHRVYEQCCKALTVNQVFIVTDHQLIYDHALSFGANIQLSKREHHSGTDRIAECLESEFSYSHVINVQGDEPFIDPKAIDFLVGQMIEKNCDIGTLANEMTGKEEYINPNIVKVVTNLKGEAMYFSRATIPFDREHLADFDFSWKKHVGIYGFKRNVLLELSQLPVSELEQSERLEQLRWLENGYKIQVGITKYKSLGIDIEHDLETAIQYAIRNNL